MARDRVLPVRAFDKDQRYGGQQIGWLRLTHKPYRERLLVMPAVDVAAEGFPGLSKREFINRFFQGDTDLTVWVVRFEFEPLQPLPSRVSESADGGAAPEPISPAAESSTPVAVEVVAETPVVDDELSYEEERDRLHLERKVERAFYEAGKALRELRDRRLYRSTHRTFEGYCRDRFGFTHRRINYLIAGSQVVENLQMGTIGSQTQENEKMGTIGSQIQNGTQGESLPDQEMGTNGAQTEMGTNGLQILPTNERQIRSLVQLEPEQQREVWQQAVTEAGGKVPSGRIVKNIVDRRMCQLIN